MILYICLLLPAVISLYIDMKLNNINKVNTIVVVKYLLYLFIINLLSNSVVYIFSEEKYRIYTNELFTFDFTFKFMWVAFIFAIILPIFMKILNDNVSLNIKVKRKDEKSTKHSK